MPTDFCSTKPQVKIWFKKFLFIYGNMRRISQYEIPSNRIFMPWLGIVVLNSDLKSIKVNDSLHLLDFNNILDTSFDLDSLSSSDKQILHRQLQLVIEQLPKKMQQIVEMRFVNNYKYGEIAAELGVSVNTVKTQLQRAKLKISAALTQLILLLLHHLN